MNNKALTALLIALARFIFSRTGTRWGYQDTVAVKRMVKEHYPEAVDNEK